MSSDSSIVKKEAAKGLDRAKQSLLIMGQEVCKHLRDICQEMLSKDMQEELDALGRKPYRELSKKQLEEMLLRNENYDEAYNEGDITGTRYATHVFKVIGDMSHDVNIYCNLYKIAAETGDSDAKAGIIDFTCFLGLDKPVIRNLEWESAEKLEKARQLSEGTLGEAKHKLIVISRLYGEEAEVEAERLRLGIKATQEQIQHEAETAKKVPAARKRIGKYRGIISAGNCITTFIKPDRTVEAIGGFIGFRKVDHLKNVHVISASGQRILALHADGSVTSGSHIFDRPNTKSWQNIVAITVGAYHCCGLKSDGTLEIQKYVQFDEHDYGQLNVSTWNNIVKVSAGAFITVGLKANGIVVAEGVLKERYDKEGKKSAFTESISSWRDIVDISAGCAHVLGLKEDGMVEGICIKGKRDKGQHHVESWYGIVAIATGSDHSVGLKLDGTVVAIGCNDNGQCNVSNWQDIVAISAGSDHTIGLKSDGTLVATGNNSHKQCNVSGVRVFV